METVPHINDCATKVAEGALGWGKTTEVWGKEVPQWGPGVEPR